MAGRPVRGKGSVEFMAPPDTLRAKVPAAGAGAIDADALARAEQVIADMSDGYLEWVEDDLCTVEAALRDLKAARPDERMRHIGRIFQVAHDIKGQGGSFGYDLMTLIADQLCRFIEKIETPRDAEIEVVRLHVDALRVVIAEGLKGDGGEHGRKLMGDLQRLVDKIAGGKPGPRPSTGSG